MKQAFTVTIEGFSAGQDVAAVIQREIGQGSWTVHVEAQGQPEEDAHAGPLVSILLPAYNYGHRIERMIASIRAQSVQDVELIVVDDGSSDDTITRVRPMLGPQDRLVCHGKNQGAAAAINTAARFATGKFMTWVSADNEMTPDWLESLLAVLAANADTGVAYANYDRFNGPFYDPSVENRRYRTWGRPYDPARLLNDQNCFIGPAFLVRAEIWRAVGDLRGRNSCDYDHWLRIEEECQRRGLTFRYHGAVLCHYYAGDERITVTRRHEYDAGVWQEEARKRRLGPRGPHGNKMGVSQATIVS